VQVTEMSAVNKTVVCFLLLLFAVSIGLVARERSTSTVTISVYNDAALPSATLREAEIVSARIFERSGIRVTWLNCSPDDPMSDAICKIAVAEGYLHLRVGRHALSLRPSVLGVAFLTSDGGSQADLFYESIENLGDDAPSQAAIILGNVMSHEIGHLLLGTNSHSPSGIMRAHWDREELRLAVAGVLSFDKSQSQLMIGRLLKAEARTVCPTIHRPADSVTANHGPNSTEMPPSEGHSDSLAPGNTLDSAVDVTKIGPQSSP
jgi:hypothetical protein